VASSRDVRVIRPPPVDALGRVTPRRDLKRSSDEELIAAMRRGDKAALEALYERHVDPMFALACRMLGTRGPAEEVVKTAFESAWLERGASRPEGRSVRAWLLRMVHDKAVDVLRGNAPAGRPSVNPLDSDEDEPAADELASRRAAYAFDPAGLLAALAQLPPEQTRVIELAYFGGYDQQEIAEMLEVSVRTVKARMRATLEHLDRVLSEGDS
jgi:RNA polymerase sigma-70 factor, ECF subfamily